MNNKKKFIIFIVSILSVIFVIYLINKDCVYETLMERRNTKESKLVEKEFLKTMRIWHSEERSGFVDTTKSDIGPIIINSSKDKCYIFVIKFYNKYTHITNVHGIKKNNQWEFTTDGAISTLTSKFSNDRQKNYELAIKRLIKGFKDSGFINILNCDVNNKIFERFRYFEMGEPDKYELENL